MRGFVALAVRRRVSVLMAALALAAFGWVGYQRLSLDLLPDITYPSLTIETDFPDTAPAEVENLITRSVEEVVGVLRGLRSIHSVSRPGLYLTRWGHRSASDAAATRLRSSRSEPSPPGVRA